MLFPESDKDALYFSMFGDDHAWSRDKLHAFELDGQHWASAEHYYQAMKFQSDEYKEIIRNADTSETARKLGKARFKRKRSDWSKVRATVMTRAIYTICHAHPNVKAELLATEQARLVENSQYDYFWGCGRDRRGDNHFGKLLVNIRAKLLAESL